jgi:hypothetical protein
VEDASDDLPNDPLFKNQDERSMNLRTPHCAAGPGDEASDTRVGGSGGGAAAASLPTGQPDSGAGGGVGGLSAALMREGAARVQQDAAAAAAGSSSGGQSGQKPVLDVVKQFAGESLMLYNGGGVGGWYTRPAVRVAAERGQGGSGTRGRQQGWGGLVLQYLLGRLHRFHYSVSAYQRAYL